MEQIPLAFDWWRCGGRIIKAPAIPPSPYVGHQIYQQEQAIKHQIEQHHKQELLLEQHQEQLQRGIKRPSHAESIPVNCHQFPVEGENSWPVGQVYDDGRHDVIRDPSDPYDMGCEISKDYWHEPYKLKKCTRICKEGPRPGWCPTKISSNCSGLVGFPPPYSRYCRNRDKLICYVCKP